MRSEIFWYTKILIFKWPVSRQFTDTMVNKYAAFWLVKTHKFHIEALQKSSASYLLQFNPMNLAFHIHVGQPIHR